MFIFKTLYFVIRTLHSRNLACP